MSDFITALQSKGGLRLAKVYQNSVDAKPKPYDDAMTFRHKRVAVTCFSDMVQTMERLRSQPNVCVVQGRVKDQYDGVDTLRRLTHIEPAAHQWLVFDVDGFDPGFDARENAKDAVEKWVQSALPGCFHDISCWVHLSARAHTTAKLKAHVWFWLAAPVLNTHIYAWAKDLQRKGKPVDPVVYRVVQVIYTADPVFEGCSDPLAERSFTIDGFMGDTVEGFEAAFDEADLEHINDTGEWDFANPSQKPGVIGAFCGEYDINRVIDELLPDLFEKVNDRRVTWLGSASGAREGCFITSDGMHFGNTSGSSPHGDRTINAFDMVRVYKFGHMDDGAEDDIINESDRPSFRAAMAFVKSLEGMDEAIAENKKENPLPKKEATLDDVDAIRERIKVSSNADEVVKIAGGANVSVLNREVLASVAHKRIEEIAKAKVKPTVVRDLIDKAAAEAHTRRIDDLQLNFVRFALDELWKGGKHIQRFSKVFWLYDNGVWRMSEDEYIRGRIHHLIESLKDDSTKFPGFQELLVELETGHRSLVETVFANIVNHVVVDGQTDPMRLCDVHLPSVINCKNGELWFGEDDGDLEFRKHNPANMFTHQISCGYDPEAKCPEWDKAVKRVFRDQQQPEEVERHFYEIMGYLLQPTRDYPMWILWHGGGSNGKSFLKDVIVELMGSKAALSRDMAEFTSKGGAHAEAELVGKLAFVEDDFKEDTLLPDAFLKKMSEAKQITANPKFGGCFNFVGRVVTWMLSNSWPRTKDASYGLARRAMVFSFNTLIEDSEKDYTLKRRILKNELPGILNKCVAGWRRVLKRHGFEIPLDCINAMEEWHSQSSSITGFIKEGIEITGNVEDTATGPEVYEAYARWCHESGLMPVSRKKLFQTVSVQPLIKRAQTRDRSVVFGGVRIAEWGIE